MGIGYTVRGGVEGLEQLKAQLRTLPKKVAGKIEKKAMGEAGKLLLRRTKALAPVRKDRRQGYKGGLLKKSLARKVKVYRNRAVMVLIVGSRKDGFRRQIGTYKGGEVARKGLLGGLIDRVAGKKSRAGMPIFAWPTKYLHLVEAGTSHSQAQRFIRRALDEVRPQVRGIFERVLTEALASVGGSA